MTWQKIFDFVHPCRLHDVNRPLKWLRQTSSVNNEMQTEKHVGQNISVFLYKENCLYKASETQVTGFCPFFLDDKRIVFFSK